MDGANRSLQPSSLLSSGKIVPPARPIPNARVSSMTATDTPTAVQQPMLSMDPLSPSVLSSMNFLDGMDFGEYATVSPRAAAAAVGTGGVGDSARPPLLSSAAAGPTHVRTHSSLGLGIAATGHAVDLKKRPASSPRKNSNVVVPYAADGEQHSMRGVYAAAASAGGVGGGTDVDPLSAMQGLQVTPQGDLHPWSWYVGEDGSVSDMGELGSARPAIASTTSSMDFTPSDDLIDFELLNSLL